MTIGIPLDFDFSKDIIDFEQYKPFNSKFNVQIYLDTKDFYFLEKKKS